MKIAFALQHILNNNFLKNVKIFKSLILDNRIWFSSKVKDFRRDALNFDSKNSFLFLFNKRETYLESILKSYFAKSLSNNNLLVIETHISTYNMSRRDELSLFIEYTLLLYTIFFLWQNFNVFNQLSLRAVKCSENNLISLRKNKKTNNIAVFFNKN